MNKIIGGRKVAILKCMPFDKTDLSLVREGAKKSLEGKTFAFPVGFLKGIGICQLEGKKGKLSLARLNLPDKIKLHLKNEVYVLQDNQGHGMSFFGFATKTGVVLDIIIASRLRRLNTWPSKKRFRQLLNAIIKKSRRNKK